MLKIGNLSLFYDENNKILKDINLQLYDGECILLTGKSGSGKSSILKCINGLAFEYENVNIKGSVQVNGNEIKNMQLYEISLMIASVFQNPKTHFFNINTTLELLFYLENMGLDRNEMDIRLKRMLNIFPIEHLLGRSIFELSGGEKQILCIASCYISGCKIIVLDEPSSNLDDKYINILKEMLIILKKQGILLIIAEHRIYYLMDIIDRVVIIEKGIIINVFTKKEFLLLSSEQVIDLGLRSIEKKILKNFEKPYGKDLVIDKLLYNFKKEKRLEIKNLSFNLGNIYGIVGKNGCGKSTFLKVMTGLEKSVKSDIYFKGKYFSAKERLKNSSLVMQDVNHQLFKHSVEEEVKLGIKDLKNENINKVLNDLNIINFKNRHPMSLSDGQKQAVAIASTICKNSKFIFFDEPTSGMDYINMMKISKIIKKIKRPDNIIFVVSHDIEFLNETIDYAINLEDFKI